MTNGEGMTKVNSRMLSESNDENFVSGCAQFQATSFGFISAFEHSCFSIGL